MSAALQIAERQPVELLLEGEAAESNKKPILATTLCSIGFSSETDLKRCVEALRASDIALRNRPEEKMLWNWTITTRAGMTISFGVAWYDMDFYRERKNAFKDARHLEQYAKFGATIEDFEVRHFVFDPS